MSDTEVGVRIVGDATAVKPAVDATKGEIQGLNAFLKEWSEGFAQGFSDQWKEIVAQQKAAMAEGAAATDKMTSSMHGLNEETKKEALSLKDIALEVFEAAEGINSFKSRLNEVAEVWMAAFAVEKVVEWAKEFAEAAEKVEQLARRFGMTTQQVQDLQAIATVTGVSLEAITSSMQVLDANSVRAASGTGAIANAFKAVGLSANDSMSQWDKLLVVADKFAQMADGPQKVALAMELMGRNGADLIPILNLGAEGLEKMKQKAEEYDVASTSASDSAQAKGAALAESINEAKLAFDGLNNLLGDTFAPVLKEIVDSMDATIAAMIRSYNEGGTVAVIFTVIKDVIVVVGDVFNALGVVFKAVWDVVSSVVTDIYHALVDVFRPAVGDSTSTATENFNRLRQAISIAGELISFVVESIGLAVKGLISTLLMFARIADDAFHMRWGAIQADWDAGLANIKASVTSSAQQMAATMADLQKSFMGFYNGTAPDAATGGVEEPKGGGTFAPKLGATPKTPKPKDDLVRQLEEELNAKKLAWAMEQDAQGTAHAFSLQEEADYWKAVLDRTDLSVKDRGEVESKYLAVHSQIVRQAWQIEEDGYKQQLAEADKNEAAKLALATAHLAEVGRMFGEESKEYAAAQAEIVKIKQEAEAQIRQLDQVRADAATKAALDQITAEENVAKQRVALGAETNAELLQQEKAFEEQRYQIQLAAAERAKNAIDPSRDPVKYAQALAAIEALERSHQAKVTQIDNQAALERRRVAQQTAQAFSGDIGKMLTLQESFSTGLMNMWESVGDIAAKAVSRMVEAFLEGLITQDVASGTLHAKEMLRHAEQAAGAAFKAVAGIPIIGPILAPAAAAAAFAGVMAFSAEGGMGDVPFDNAPFLLHKNEMVLPANLATPLRSMLTGGVAPMLAGASSGSGGFHYHDHTERGVTPDQIIANSSAVAKAVRMAHRNGAFAGTKLNF